MALGSMHCIIIIRILLTRLSPKRISFLLSLVFKHTECQKTTQLNSTQLFINYHKFYRKQYLGDL